MPFGKRRGFPGASGAPPEQPSRASEPKPEFPGARQVGPQLIAFGPEQPHPDHSGVQRILRFLTESYTDPNGMQAETCLSAIGALAGFAAQQAIWEGFVRPRKLAATQVFVQIGTKSGETFFFGDLLNTILASTREGELSIWRLVAAVAVQAGSPSLPMLAPLFEACAATVGTPEFDRPKQLKTLPLKETYREALRHWAQIKSILVTAGVEPLHWPLEIAVAAQQLIGLTRDVVDPDIAALIVMEAAIPMSRIDPRTVPGATMVE